MGSYPTSVAGRRSSRRFRFVMRLSPIAPRAHDQVANLIAATYYDYEYEGFLFRVFSGRNIASSSKELRREARALNAARLGRSRGRELRQLPFLSECEHLHIIDNFNHQVILLHYLYTIITTAQSRHYDFSTLSLKVCSRTSLVCKVLSVPWHQVIERHGEDHPSSEDAGQDHHQVLVATGI